MPNAEDSLAHQTDLGLIATSSREMCYGQKAVNPKDTTIDCEKFSTGAEDAECAERAYQILATQSAGMSAHPAIQRTPNQSSEKSETIPESTISFSHLEPSDAAAVLLESDDDQDDFEFGRRPENIGFIQKIPLPTLGTSRKISFPVQIVYRRFFKVKRSISVAFECPSVVMCGYGSNRKPYQMFKMEMSTKFKAPSDYFTRNDATVTLDDSGSGLTSSDPSISNVVYMDAANRFLEAYKSSDAYESELGEVELDPKICGIDSGAVKVKGRFALDPLWVQSLDHPPGLLGHDTTITITRTAEAQSAINALATSKGLDYQMSEPDVWKARNVNYHIADGRCGSIEQRVKALAPSCDINLNLEYGIELNGIYPFTTGETTIIKEPGRTSSNASEGYLNSIDKQLQAAEDACLEVRTILIGAATSGATCSESQLKNFVDLESALHKIEIGHQENRVIIDDQRNSNELFKSVARCAVGLATGAALGAFGEVSAVAEGIMLASDTIAGVTGAHVSVAIQTIGAINHIMGFDASSSKCSHRAEYDSVCALSVDIYKSVSKIAAKGKAIKEAGEVIEELAPHIEMKAAVLAEHHPWDLLKSTSGFCKSVRVWAARAGSTFGVADSSCNTSESKKLREKLSELKNLAKQCGTAAKSANSLHSENNQSSDGDAVASNNSGTGDRPAPESDSLSSLGGSISSSSITSGHGGGETSVASSASNGNSVAQGSAGVSVHEIVSGFGESSSFGFVSSQDLGTGQPGEVSSGVSPSDNGFPTTQGPAGANGSNFGGTPAYSTGPSQDSTNSHGISNPIGFTQGIGPGSITNPGSQSSFFGR